MNRALLAALLIAAPLASAADAGQGQVAFRQACGNCHTATQHRVGQTRPKKRASRALPHMGPDLGVALRGSGQNAFKRWVKDPWTVQPRTACDPRLLKPGQVEDLIAFLSTRTRPEPPRERRAPSAGQRRQR